MLGPGRLSAATTSELMLKSLSQINYCQKKNSRPYITRNLPYPIGRGKESHWDLTMPPFWDFSERRCS